MRHLSVHVEVCYFPAESTPPGNGQALFTLFNRLPSPRAWNRNLLLVALAILTWSFDLVWDLVYVVLYPAQGTHPLPVELEAHVLSHAMSLPTLLLCYFGAISLARMLSNRWAAFLTHVLIGFAYASLGRLYTMFGVYLAAGDVNALGTHYHGLLDAGFSLPAWLDYALANILVYSLGLFMILGVNARLDLENERIRSSDLYTLWLNARLDTLRSQLNPHFLFNSLHTISSLLFTDTRRADKLLADFSDVLRITLRDGQREFASVREELDYARRYLSIEETRFEDRLSTQFETEEASLGARVPSLILQPLIENAIKYGISSSSGRNHVTITARCGGDTLVLEICNDFRNEAAVSPDRKMGIGLRNVRERLSAIYGADFILTSEPVSGQRWSSRICIPYTSAGEA